MRRVMGDPCALVVHTDMLDTESAAIERCVRVQIGKKTHHLFLIAQPLSLDCTVDVNIVVSSAGSTLRRSASDDFCQRHLLPDQRRISA